MANLVITSTFLDEVARLDNAVRVDVKKTIGKFKDGTLAGIQLEKYNNQKDPRARTIRINLQYRGIVIKPDTGEDYILTRVLKHDEAERWMHNNTFSVNEATGALEVVDEIKLGASIEAFDDAPAPAAGPLIQVPNKGLKALGVDERVFPVLKKITEQEELDGLLEYMPPAQADALSMLAAGYSVEEAWKEIVNNEPVGEVDQDDLVTAATRPASQSSFYVAEDDVELLEILNRPFELWRHFLHPSQRMLATKDFNGPARVTGGAGTGKTVAAMHRARNLADRIVKGETSDRGERILFTTFTKNLADELERQLSSFCSEEQFKRIDVRTVDSLASAIVRDSVKRPPRIHRDTIDTWQEVIDELGLAYSAEFLNLEWEQVILAGPIRDNVEGPIRSKADYLSTPRTGRGYRLDRRARAEVWRAVEMFEQKLREANRATFEQQAEMAAFTAAMRSVKPYAHVIFDEAQDLHPSKWRLLRAVVAEGPNDIFIVGDSHQRIYNNRVSLKSVGIEVRGRSRRLKINYRTTHEIMSWALGVLRGEFDDLGGENESQSGYRSTLHGPAPELVGYTTTGEELEGLVERIKQWEAEGVELETIGIAARSWSKVKSVAKSKLSEANIRIRDLDDSGDGEGVRAGTMHRMKGLEFRKMAVIDAGAETLPGPVTPESDDPTQHELDLQRERCLVYVACTRARDELRVSWSGARSELLTAD